MAPPRRTSTGVVHHHRRHLSARQLEVLGALVMTGSEKGAAYQLGMAPATVKRHLANARAKAGGVTTGQLIRIYSAGLPLPDGMAQIDE